MSIEQEIRSLKRQLKRTRQFMATALIAGVVVMCMGQAKEKEAIPEYIETKVLAIVDDKGKPQITMTVSGKDAIITVGDAASGNAVAIFASRGGDARVSLLGPKGTKAEMVAAKDGTNSLSIFDGEDKPRAALIAGNDGSAAVAVSDSKAPTRAILGTAKNSTGLLIRDEKGAHRLIAGIEEGEAGIIVADEKGAIVFEKP